MNALPPVPQFEGVEVRHCPGHAGYAVSSDGRVFSCKNARWGYRPQWHQLRTFIDSFGYPVVAVGAIRGANKSHSPIRVHVLVLEAFIGPRPDDMVVCHDPDPTPSNCNLSNLRWDSFASNSLDSIRHQRVHRVLTKDDVRFIRSMRGRKRQIDLAAKFGVNQGLISAVQIGKYYKYY